MAKGCYVGVSSKARKVKKIYVGVAGTARKVKKAYVGVGGVARLWWSGGTLSYYGTATALSVARLDLAASTADNSEAVFGGGRTNNNYNSQSNVVNGYNASLSMTTASSGLQTARYQLAAAKSGSYIIFAGGRTGASAVTGRAEAYNASLTRTALTALGTNRGKLSGATTGNYAIFAGGDNGGSSGYGAAQNKIDAYSGTTKQSLSSTLGTARFYICGATTGNYALFAGGATAYSSYQLTPSTAIDAFNGLTKVSTSVTLSAARVGMAGTSLGSYAVFAGGAGDAVYVFNGLTKVSTSATLSNARNYLAATTIGDFAVFAGGSSSNTVDVFDTSITRQTLSLTLNTARSSLSAATVGNNAIFAGGYTGSAASNVADVFQVV